MKRKVFFLIMTSWLTAPAWAGLPEALMSLNYQQYSNAFSEFKELADQGSPTAFYYLGRMYQNGWGVQKNIPQAVAYFKAADKAYYLPAAAQLGKILLHGSTGVPADPKTAIDLLKKSALAGDDEAAFELGNSIVDGLNEDTNYNHAFGYYSIAALKGNKKAQFQLGQMYLIGRGIPQNYQKAMQWFSRAAHQGFVQAQLKLADLTENNPKLKSLGEAYAWNAILAAYNSDAIGTKASKKRDILATKLSSKDLSKWQAEIRTWTPKTPAQSVPKEERETTDAFVIPEFNDPKTLQQILLSEGILPQDASAFGLTMEQIDLAEATGNKTELVQTIEKALKANKKKAAAYLGDILNHRIHDPQEAIKWYQKGADLKDPYAQYQLAKANCEGWTGSANTAECYRWLLNISDTPDPVLNGVVQQALMAVRANASQAELEKGKELFDNSQKEAAAESKKKKILDFF